ncbi:hypothetical protein [Merdibacter massiliensis]|uniref:hypothetical protein n=1 Tax=Merdibacter massiliensis TaxID=1871030 RepID=UPI00096A6201|nr:hypothetical protein [Merdibacter massiliensis]
MKKLLKGGIAAAIACSALVGTVNPVSAKTVDTSLQTGIKEAAEEIETRFLYTITETVSSWEFDTVVTYDMVETTQTSTGWRMAGLVDVELVSKLHNIIAYKYTYSYYDNYQGIKIDIEYDFVFSGINHQGKKTVKVHV